MMMRCVGVAAFVASLAPGVTRAQSAWVPPRGEMSIAATYQWLSADRHLFDDLTGPELTPLEIARGIDYHSNSLDFGTVQSHAMLVEADAGVTERLALTGSVAFIAPRYQGAFPHPGPGDDGAFHGTIQDVQVGARYMAGNDVWAFTPFTAFTAPLRDYEVLAHAAQGLKLRQLEIGTGVGRILLSGGAARGYVQGSYGYSFVERTEEDVPLNRSRATLEVGMFLGRFTLQGTTTWRRVHGGLEWSDVAFGSHEHFEGHDQSAATREWRYGVGVSYQLARGNSIDISYGRFINGANTHDARVIAIGWTSSVQIFEGPTIGAGFK